MILSDDEYLNFQILNLENSYVGEMTYIKDCNNKFLYVSSEFAKAFEIESEFVIGKDTSIVGVPPKVAQDVLEQEKILLTCNCALDSIYVHRHEDRVVSYLMRKRLLRNPYTKNVMGVLGSAVRFMPGHFRKVYLQLVKQTFNLPSRPQYKLTKLQNEIVFCLLMGFSTRKEIASVIGFLAGEHDEHKVKNALYALYDIFDCNSTTALLNNVLLNDVDLQIPDAIIEPCSIVVSNI